jgi:hypothetical protein
MSTGSMLNRHALIPARPMMGVISASFLILDCAILSAVPQQRKTPARLIYVQINGHDGQCGAG